MEVNIANSIREVQECFCLFVVCFAAFNEVAIFWGIYLEIS